MDKETLALVIAQNGLLTAATLLTAKAVKLQKAWDKAKTAEEKAAIQKQITKASKLSTMLKIVNQSILEYQQQTD